MKALNALILMFILILLCAKPVIGFDDSCVGVKKGDWIEYSINIKGPALDGLRNLTWYKAEILEVRDSLIVANKTALTVNGTLLSSIWTFNFTEGQVQGWVIIPANLDVGESFFDNTKNTSIIVEGEEYKTILGATRAITYASDPGKVYKEWDKSTGVYVHAIEFTTSYTIITKAIATNMWSPEILGIEQALFFGIVGVIVMTGLIFVFFNMRKRL